MKTRYGYDQCKVNVVEKNKENKRMNIRNVLRYLFMKNQKKKNEIKLRIYEAIKPNSKHYNCGDKYEK